MPLQQTGYSKMIILPPLLSFRYLKRFILGLLAVFTAPLIFAQSELEDSDYRLSKGDSVSIEVHNQSDLQTLQAIDEQGRIHMKYIGVVKLEGLTVREAENMLENEYINQRYLRAPDVTVQVSRYSSKPVIVRGAINSPGLVELGRHPNGLDIFRVIAMAGGLRDVAKASAVRVIREDSQGSTKIYTVDISSKGMKKRTERFIVLPNDIIEVDETTF